MNIEQFHINIFPWQKNKNGDGRLRYCG